MSSMNIRLLVAFLLALALSILPLPELIVGIRPPWILLLMLYVQFYLPDRFSLAVLILMGLILDTLLSTIIGEHTFALSIVTWIASSKSRRFCLFSIGQQMALVGIAALVYQLCIFGIDIILGGYASLFDVLGSAVISVLIWPWIRLLTEDTLLTKIHPRSQFN
ncbi:MULTISPECIES: rod shape-determining protein MreD [Legionella]|uniref:Rod shape-determining protein MreD n=1 Tax=Legionella quinlivanii TaxID=45073 RepID=A0A364LNF2_9GAMM|nr:MULTISPECIES: rod shape-determining protein MreD [Legionella]MCE3046147.1 rod shape-determining protein MreD [Legionella sp. 16cNR16C]RAP38565.1 rod shape-determining protein MreD [Legionella quinlivanii]